MARHSPPGSGPIEVTILPCLPEDPAACAAWDELAARHGRPLATPAWAAAWWAHLAPRGAIARVILCRRRGELLGVWALHARRRLGLWHYRGAGAPGTALRGAALAAPGHEEEVGAAMAAAVARLAPAPAHLTLDAVEVDDALGRSLSASLPGGMVAGEPSGAPVVVLDPGGHEAWLAAKSGNFRADVRRKARRLDAAGGVLARAQGPDVESALDAFETMHARRWGERSILAGAGGRAALRAGARRMREQGRLEVWTITGPGGIAAVHLFMRAGDTSLFMNGAWDEAWRDTSPGLLSLVAAIEHAHSQGLAVVDLGDGDQRYKARLADHDRPVADLVWVAPGLRGACVREARRLRRVGRSVRAVARRARRGIRSGGGRGPGGGPV